MGFYPSGLSNERGSLQCHVNICQVGFCRSSVLMESGLDRVGFFPSGVMSLPRTNDNILSVKCFSIL